MQFLRNSIIKKKSSIITQIPLTFQGIQEYRSYDSFYVHLYYLTRNLLQNFLKNFTCKAFIIRNYLVTVKPSFHRIQAAPPY